MYNHSINKSFFKEGHSMKKFAPILFGILLFFLGMNFASAKSSVSNSTVASAIKLYKSGNYVQSYDAFYKIVTKDPSNAVAFYYLAMSSAQLGRKAEAIINYEKVLTLSPGGKLGYYAAKGKTCLESPDKCNSESDNITSLDRFIQSNYGSGFSDEARSEYEKLKIQNMMREINRKDEINPEKFKEYNDFSSQAPTNDEIVMALRILQKAGLGNMVGGNGYSNDLSLLTGSQGLNNNNYEMLNMLMGTGNNNTLSPQVIQSLLTNQMSAGF